MKYLLTFFLFVLHASAYGTLAGGRPNAISEGQNAFAGVINPANTVWIPNRIDIGTYWVHQKSSVSNKDNNPYFPPGKTSYTHHCQNLFTVDAAFHKHFEFCLGGRQFDSSFTLATYTMPSFVKLRTKDPIRLSGTTPTCIYNRTNVISGVYSLKLNEYHSIGVSIDYLNYSHKRNGFQNADNPIRSVSPGNVTNNGFDHSSGIGGGIGWRWNITKKLTFGATWTRKSYCGQYRRYRGYEPHHAKNYHPQNAGAGFSYKFTPRLAGRIEVLWMQLGNLPGANNSVLPDGSLNRNKRGSTKSPGPGLNDATYINMGMGYKVNTMLSIGAGYSHRVKLNKRNSNFISHTYMLQTIYNTLSLGANFRRDNHDLFFSFTYGFRNRVSGYMPEILGGGRFVGQKQNISCSLSWGYIY